MKNGFVSFELEENLLIESKCLIADTKEDRIKGLSGLEKIEIPMVFPETKRTFLNYTMKQMLCPILIMFFNKYLRCSYFKMAYPFEEVFYYGEPVYFVIECPELWGVKYNFKNCKVTIS